jgi:hypothetical protein
MAQKRITDLQLISALADTVDFPVDDGIQTYRATGAQMKKFCSTWINVKDYGAIGDGVTDDTAAINLALAAGSGKRVFFPKGTYIVNDIGTAYSSLKYSLIFTGTNVSIEGEGDSSVIQISAHEKYCSLIDVKGASGKISIRNLKLKSPTRVNTTHNGPIGIEYGEFGVTTGTITEIDIDNVSFENLSFFVHGQGAKFVKVRNCRGNIQGGGVYPTYFSELLNIGSQAGYAYRTLRLQVTDNVFTHDGTYDDHGIYAIGPIDTIIIERNTHTNAPKDAIYKIDYGTGTPTIEYISVSDNETPAETSAEGFITLAGAATATKAKFNGNRTDTPGRFIDSEWAFQNVEVVGNNAPNSQYGCVSFVKNSLLSVIGVCTVSDNNFKGYNSVQDSSIGLTLEAFKVINLLGNDITAAGASSGTPLTYQNHSIATLIGNTSDKVPSVLTLGNSQKVTSLGNSWDRGMYFASAVPAAQPHVKGEIVWNNDPDAGEPAFWVCVSSGTPGTWVDGPAVGGFYKINRLATPQITIASTGTPITNLAQNNSSFIEFTGSTATTIQGIAPGVDGQRLIIYNATGANMTFAHNNGSAVSNGKIYTQTAADVSTSGTGTAELVYSATQSAWVLLYVSA